MFYLRVCLVLFGFVYEVLPDDFEGSLKLIKTTCDCGKANKDAGIRIVGGEVTLQNEYPFMAYVRLGKRVCGGSIITSRHILTAAHCTDGIDASKSHVTVAQHNRHKRTPHRKTYYVQKIIQYPSYISVDKDDISILLLKKEIKFNVDVGRVCLPTGPLNIEHKIVTNMGWGRYTSHNKNLSSTLRQVNLKVLSFKECTKAWIGKIPKENPKQLCTYAKGKNSCSGDSGGPIVWLDPETNRYTQVSLNSFGKATDVYACGNSLPRIGTRISSYLDWIKKTIDDTVPLPICTKE